MSLEPGIAGLVVEATSALVAPDWTAYRTCRICKAETGKPCVARYGRVVNGRTEGGPQTLTIAHGHRKRLSGR